MDVVEQLQQAEDEQAPVYETTDGKPYAEDFSNLSDIRIGELRSVCTTFDKRDQWARMIEIIRCTLRRYFFIGQQHPYWNQDAGQMQVGPSGDSGFGGDPDLNEEEFYEEEFNIFTAEAKIFMAVFSQNAAPSRMEPDKPKDGDSVKAAKEAEKYVEVYQKYNPAKCAQMDVSRLMWTDGRILAVTDYETDEEKCGLDEQGNPQGAEFTKYYGVPETKVPIIGDFKSWPYAKVSEDMDIATAKHDNPNVADKLEAAKGSLPNNEIARMSRIAVSEGISQVSSDTLAYLVTEDRWWLRPSAFTELPKDRRAFWVGGKSQAEDGTVTEQAGLFPNGCRAKFFGQVFAGLANVTMDAQLKVMHAMPGNGNSRPSLSDAMVPIQMEFNDAIGMYSEMIHKCIPHTLVNCQAEALQAITEQFSRYGEWASIDLGGRALAENIFQEAQIDVPASFEQWVTNLQGPLTQRITGNYPALVGANMEDQKTARGYQQAKESAQGLMAIVWIPYLEFASGIRWQAARLAAKREQDSISAILPLKDGKSKVIDIDVGVLRRGGFLSAAITDENFPESHGDRAAKWMMLYQDATANPQGISAQLFQEPDNLVELKDAAGIDITIKGAAARDKQLAEWEQMQPQKGGDGPIPDPQKTLQQEQQKQQAAQQAVDAVAPGTQAPPVPPEPIQEVSSVPTRLADDHIEEARTCVRILNDSETLEMLETMPEVVHDLELHLIEHLTKAQQGGIVIPPDLLGIIPPPMPPPGMMPPGPIPPGAPHAGPQPPPVKGAPNAPAA